MGPNDCVEIEWTKLNEGKEVNLIKLMEVIKRTHLISIG